MKSGSGPEDGMEDCRSPGRRMVSDSGRGLACLMSHLALLFPLLPLLFPFFFGFDVLLLHCHVFHLLRQLVGFVVGGLALRMALGDFSPRRRE